MDNYELVHKCQVVSEMGSFPRRKTRFSSCARIVSIKEPPAVIRVTVVNMA